MGDVPLQSGDNVTSATFIFQFFHVVLMHFLGGNNSFLHLVPHPH